MKKKIVLILSIMAIAICIFALTISASNYLDISEFDVDIDNYYSITFLMNVDMDCTCEGFSPTEVFGLVEFYIGDGYIYGFVNVEFWHLLFQNLNIKTEEDFNSILLPYLIENSYLCNCSSLYSTLLYGSSLAEVLKTYENYVRELNRPTYEDGHRDGYNEGHKFGYDIGYGAGLIEGETEFKESVEYQNSLDIARTEGRSEGKMEFVNSKEYANALSIEYDKGFQDGINDDSVETSDVIGMALGVGLIAALAIICIMAFSKKKRRY